ncbi:MAG: DUF2752 domain-containing protein [Clostridia bacterium]|nr:DUF2752 domain-containing protein [Clostridia bacterium]
MKFTEAEKNRLFAVAKKTGIVLAIGIVYAVFVRLSGRGIPCVFNLITGLKCPGCGISRMFLALFRLDVVAAAHYNLLVLCLLPFALVLFFYKSWQYIKDGETKMYAAEKLFYCVALVLCFAFFVLRNFTNVFP